MLRRGDQIIGLHLHAKDGDVGRVHDLLFDDHSWGVRYLTVDTGQWLPGRKVLISPASVSSIQWDDGTLTVDLTVSQLEDSPPLQSDLPVSRQHEKLLVDYFGWPAYWAPFHGYMGAEPQYPMAAPRTAENVEPAPEEQQGDPCLRSSREVTGYHVEARDGSLGHVEDFLVDTNEWLIRYLIVDTRNLLPGKKVLISPDWLIAVNWEGRHVSLDLTQQNIKDSPEYDPNQSLTREDEQALHHAHGRDGYWSG